MVLMGDYQVQDALIDKAVVTLTHLNFARRLVIDLILQVEFELR